MSDKIEQKNSFNLENLRKLIDTKTREEIATALKCDTSLITKHYNDQRIITVDYLIKYAEYFNVSVDYLLNKTDNKIAVDTDEGKLIRSICDYTGLSENAVNRLHSFSIPTVIAPNPEDLDDEMKEFIERARQKATLEICELFKIINYFISSDNFYEAVYLINEYFESIKNSTNYIESSLKKVIDKTLSPDEIIDEVDTADLKNRNSDRLFYFEAIENINSIVNSYCEDETDRYKNATRKLLYLKTAIFPITVSPETNDISFGNSLNFGLTGEEENELNVVRDIIINRCLEIRKGFDSNANHNEEE